MPMLPDPLYLAALVALLLLMWMLAATGPRRARGRGRQARRLGDRAWRIHVRLPFTTDAEWGRFRTLRDELEEVELNDRLRMWTTPQDPDALHLRLTVIDRDEDGARGQVERGLARLGYVHDVVRVLYDVR